METATTRRCRRWGHKWFPYLDGDHCERFGCHAFRPSPFQYLLSTLRNGSDRDV